MRPEATVIVACYYPETEKLKMTLRSILLQQDVRFEIIIADDGSPDPRGDEIEALMKQHCFSEYTLLFKEKNEGTVRNMTDAVMKARGRYTKMISPGDMFYRQNTLRQMVDFMDTEQALISFSDCVFYNRTDGKTMIRSVENSPRKPYLFDKECFDRRKVMDEYILMGHNIIGASFFAETETMRRYFRRVDGSVKYLEDYAYKIALVEGIPIYHQSLITVWYEYAVGITVSKDPEKQKRMLEDAYGAYNLIEEAMPSDTWYHRRVGLYLKNIRRPTARKLIKAVFFPVSNLKRAVKKEKTVFSPSENISMEFFEKLTEDKEL